jgi:branched-chain amino acid transport system ATP-binding protein
MQHAVPTLAATAAASPREGAGDPVARPGASTPLLQVQGLHAGYGRAEVLTGLDFELARGSVVTVIGPNGAGKSTTLNALMGLLPSRGRVLFDGQDLAGATLEERVMLGLALVPEKRELFGTMAVEDNLVLGGFRPMKLRVPNWRGGLERVYELFPRLKERRQQLAGTLSGGERQMLAVGRALMAQPKLLMLDEPSLGLAPLIVREIFQIIGRLRQDGVAILLVEQNARAALEVADYGYVLETGEISLQGPAVELAGDPRVIETYLGAARPPAA